VHRAAHLLGNEAGRSSDEVRASYAALLAEIAGHHQAEGLLGRAARQFLKVTESYWAGLFHCYRVADLPRTNNDLEHAFGSGRYHERRASGRKVASPATVVRGAVRIVAALATRLRTFLADELRLRDLARWRTLRTELEQRHEARRLQLRFRRDPASYLGRLEEALLKQSLPP
jgi:hypothetical protein